MTFRIAREKLLHYSDLEMVPSLHPRMLHRNGQHQDYLGFVCLDQMRARNFAKPSNPESAKTDRRKQRQSMMHAKLRCYANPATPHSYG
jgi:hypothetical protein